MRPKRIKLGLFDFFKTSPKTETALTGKEAGQGITRYVQIPEPTLSLLWITNEDTSKWQSAGSVNLQMTVSIDEKTGQPDVTIEDLSDTFFSEPSLIWSQLRIEPNNDIYDEPIYYPTYAELTPKGKYQYLSWLTDITQKTNLSYVFLYFYGLERHLVAGDYDKAVDEIVRLVKSHPEPMFVKYATNSLIAASMKRKRVDILKRAPFLLHEETDLALALRILRKTTLSPEDVISLANSAGFSNKRYVKQHPELFKVELSRQIAHQEKIGALLSVLSLKEFKTIGREVFANMSFPDEVRTQNIHLILEDQRFQKAIYTLLDTTHQVVKKQLKEKRAQKTRA